MRFIYDLDHTVIDSSHRQLTLADGSLDLDHWVENNTPEKIARDRLLPLARHWRAQRERGCEIVVCTARVMGAADYEYLRANNLEWDACLSRPLGNTNPDGELKFALLQKYARAKTHSWARFCKFSLMIDDNKNVIAYLTARGLRVYNALEINARLAA